MQKEEDKRKRAVERAQSVEALTEFVREHGAKVLYPFESTRAIDVFAFICKEKVTTAPIIEEETRLPEATIYKVLKRLVRTGLIRVERLKIDRGRKGGPPTRIFKSVDASKEDVIELIRREGGREPWTASFFRGSSQ